ncbi:MAG: FixH family protein [Acidobacteria bacterium]|nr:FixH family protein [Acidobacteriota bacterium]
MRRLMVMLGLVAVGGFAAACGGNQQPAGETAPAAQAPAAPAAGAAQDLKITFTSNPAPPKTGENRFEVMVMDHNGQPVTDATVSAEFYMAAMPQMNMPEMRNRVDLAHEGSGRYTGTGMVMMAGSWDVTVTVSRGGQTLDSEKIAVAAK